MRIAAQLFFKAVILILCVASSARADDWKPVSQHFDPRGISLADSVREYAERQKPRWADEQNGFVGYRPNDADVVYGVRVDHRTEIGFSWRFN